MDTVECIQTAEVYDLNKSAAEKRKLEVNSTPVPRQMLGPWEANRRAELADRPALRTSLLKAYVFVPLTSSTIIHTVHQKQLSSMEIPFLVRQVSLHPWKFIC